MRPPPAAVQAAAVALLAAVPLAPALSPDVTLAWRDSAILLEPVRTLAVSELRAFRLPLWNPYEGTGQALLGQAMHGVLHPVSVLTAFLGGGIDLWLAGLVAFAAAGAFLAARALRLSAWAAAGAAFAYALSGYVLGMTSNATYLAGAATAPWVVAGLVVAAGRGGAAIVAGAAGVACAVLAGDPQSVVTSTCVGVALGLAAPQPAPPVPPARRLLRAGAAIVLGAAAAAVQLVPSWAYLRTTTRAAGAVAAAELGRWALDPVRLVELVAPGFFMGRPRAWVAPVFTSLGSPSTYPLPFSPSVFVGAAAILLAVLAAVRSREGRVLAALAVLFAWAGLGHHAGAAQLLARVPLWGAFLYSEKLVGPMTLCLALAAGVGIDLAGRLRRVVAGALALAATFAALAASCALEAGWLTRTLGALGAAPDVARLAQSHLLEGSLHAALGAGALAALAHAAPRLAAGLPPALAALLFVQSAAASPFAIHLGDARASRGCPPALEAPPPGPRVLTALVHNVEAPEGGLDPIDAAVERWSRVAVPSLNVRCAVDTVEGYTGFETRRAAETIFEPAQRLALGSRFGATHVLSEPPRGVDEARLLQRATAGGQLVSLDAQRGVAAWAIPHRPWASFAPSVRAAKDVREAVAALGEEMAAGRPTVILEGAADGCCAGGRVLAVERRHDRLAVEAESGGDALLVLNDAFDPGWRATIDGRAAEVLPADVLVRAVRWPPGRHRLVMRYEPPEVAAGAWISGIAVLGCAAWVAAGEVARRRARSALPAS